MASLQAKVTNGRKYWYIVQSKRINGKPRPIVLKYLGTTEDLVSQLLHATEKGGSLKSYIHGSVAALLSVMKKLDLAFLKKIPLSSKILLRKRDLEDNEASSLQDTQAIGFFLATVIGGLILDRNKRGLYSSFLRKQDQKGDLWEWYSLALTTSFFLFVDSSFPEIEEGEFWKVLESLSERALKEIEQELMQRSSLYYEVGGARSKKNLLLKEPLQHGMEKKERIIWCLTSLGFLLEASLWEEVKEKTPYPSLDKLFKVLNRVRLFRRVEQDEPFYQLEEMNEEEKTLMQSLGLLSFSEVAKESIS